ncbi:MAG: L-seryl-tRNA(Sec) selenium transferase [Desulfobacterales bacterium]|jgi:L-seryl-tRNA(Ser) seleniumtransferase
MKINDHKQRLLRQLPGVDHILELANGVPYFEAVPKAVLIRSIRAVVDTLRAAILSDRHEFREENLSDSLVLEEVKAVTQKTLAPKLLHTVNATGVVVHTNLGRSLLARTALENLQEIASNYSNLEFDLTQGKRGSRYSAVEGILRELSGAEAALVVNNNAGAVLLCLETIARNKKVIISRGELVEIGGSFRIPDVMAKSGGILCEVGTTNRTHLRDYESAIDNNSGLLLKVHRSNYSVVGFSAEVSLGQLVQLGEKYHIPVMEDLGSGTFIDFSKYGLLKEPTVQESVSTGADVVTYSGDKLLGGPQAGLIVGKKDIIDLIKKNPITRALRIDKMTLAALESTLRLYRNEEAAICEIPTLRMLTLPIEQIKKKAQRFKKCLEKIDNSRMQIELIDLSSRAGGGSLPLLELPSQCVGVKVKQVSPNAIERFLRHNRPPIIGRIYEDFFAMDLRTIQDDELLVIETAFKQLLEKA